MNKVRANTHSKEWIAAADSEYDGGPQLSRQKQNARVKSKTLASKAKQWRQKQNHRVKSKTVASKAKRCLASTAKRSRQKPNARVKIKQAF